MPANITRVRQRIEADRAIGNRPRWIDPNWTPLPDTWPLIVIQRLRRNGVETWQQLERLTEAEALSWPGVGPDTIRAIRQLCDQAGRKLQSTVVSGGPSPHPPMVMPVEIVFLPAHTKSG